MRYVFTERSVTFLTGADLMHAAQVWATAKDPTLRQAARQLLDEVNLLQKEIEDAGQYRGP